jgi:hypothetical protein
MISQNKKNGYLNASILLSLCCLIAIIYINKLIAIEYNRSDGKTQALFGIKEILQFSYQYYIVIPVIISVILAVLGSDRKQLKKRSILVITLNCLILLTLFLRIWRLM